MKTRTTSRGIVALLAFALLSPWFANAQPADDDPGFAEMSADLLIARPLLLLTTIAGTTLFVASLPFTATGGNVGDAGEALLGGPMRATFNRCLGCRASAPKREEWPEDR